jgi:hypothetical protein
LGRLKKKAEEMTAERTNIITAGHSGEKQTQEVVGTFLVRKLPDDPDCIRISIGQPTDWPSPSGALAEVASYVVVRGRIDDAIDVLERALCALKLSSVEALAGLKEV